MAILDFMGWRLVNTISILLATETILQFQIQIAMSLLPINKQTIIYGSDDGGETIHSEDYTFACIIEKLGAHLNIKPRKIVSDKGDKTLFTAIDVEGHLGTDGRYYLLGMRTCYPSEQRITTTADLSRMFPPTTPNKELTASHLFQLFRPEVLLFFSHFIASTLTSIVPKNVWEGIMSRCLQQVFKERP